MRGAARALSLLLLLAAGACGQDAVRVQTPLESPPESPDEDPVRLAVAAAEDRVPLGGEIVFRVTLSNSGRKRVQVNVPRIDRHSLTFSVRRPDGTIVRLERFPVRYRPDGTGPEADPPSTAEIEPGGSLTQEVRVVAVQGGKFAFVPLYRRQGALKPLAADAAVVEVLPEGANTRLGVRLATSHGPMTAVLRPDLAWCTVESFASLVKRGFYDRLTFHRIIRGFMAQGGDPKGDGTGGPGWFLPREVHTGLNHTRGVFSMARSQHPDTAGSQFFICFGARPDLDPEYTTFGQLVEGDDALAKIEAVPTTRGGDGNLSAPTEPVTIEKAELVTLP